MSNDDDFINEVTNIVTQMPPSTNRVDTPLLFPERQARAPERVVRLRRTKDDYRQYLDDLIAKLNKYVASAKAGAFTNLFNDEQGMHAISSDVATARRLTEYKAEFSGTVDELLDLLKRNWSQDNYRLLENNIHEELSEHLKKEKENKGYNANIRTTLPLTPFFQSKEEYILWYNERHFAVKVNGVLRVGSESDLELMKKSDFFDLYAGSVFNTGTADKPKYECTAKLWYQDNRRRTYKDGLTFDPSRVYAVDENQYNLFKSFPIVPIAGDCTIFLNYVKEIICSNNEEHFNYLIALVAQMFQFPHLKPGIAVVLRGDEGVGKSLFIEKLGALMGPYYFKTSNPAYIFGDHNSQLKDKLLCHLEEAVWAGSKKDDSLFKDLITRPTLEINEKFVPVHSVPNHLHVFLSGNPDWLVKAALKARRIFALHVSDAQRTITEYFAGIDKWFTSGGAAHLMHYFMNHKSGINLRNVPITEELIFQKTHSFGPVEEYFMSIGYTCEWPYGEIKDDGVYVIKRFLYYDFCRSPMGHNTKMSERQFGGAFLKLFPEIDDDGVAQKYDSGGVRSIIIQGDNIKCNGFDKYYYAYKIPKDVDVYRRAFESNLSGKTE
jgi:Family of unknown function (DUF5906)